MKIRYIFLSDDLVEIIKKALCFPLQMDSQKTIKSHLDDNRVSNGPHMALKHTCTTCVIWPISPKKPPDDLNRVTDVSMPLKQKKNIKLVKSIEVIWRALWPN